MAKSRPAVSLKDLLPTALKRLKMGGRPTLEAMQEAWQRAAGEKAAAHSWPRRWVRGRLVVEVESSGWMYALNLRRERLLEGIVELLGAGWAKDLRFRIGEGKEGKGET